MILSRGFEILSSDAFMQQSKKWIELPPALKILGYCLLLFLISRILFFEGMQWLNQELHFHIAQSYLFAQLDTKWYVGIVKHGYQTHAHNDVFFPLFPLLMAGVAKCTGLSIHVAGFIVTNLCFFLASCLFYRLLEEETDAKMARLGTGLLCFTPYSVYFMAAYTESLFLFLSLACWLTARHRQWLGLGCCGFLLSLTHPNGVIIFIMALLFVWEDYRLYHEKVWRYWPVLLIPCGLGGYMLYLGHTFHNAFDFVTSQQYWAGRTGWHLEGLALQFQDRLHGESYNLIVFFMGLALSVYLWRKGYLKEALFIPLFTIMAPLSGSFLSLARYTATLFPFYFALTLIMEQYAWMRSFWFIGLLAIVSMIFFCWGALFWLNNSYIIF